MNKKILAVNAGSSSIKFKVYDYNTLNEIASGLCERIFVDGVLVIEYNGQKVKNEVPMPNHDTAIKIVLNALVKMNIISNLNEIVGVGHRVAMGGTYFKNSSLMNKKEVDIADEYSKLAPLHNHPECEVIRIFEKQIPTAKNVGVFDTSYHTTIPQKYYDYSLDRKTTEKYEIRRYGFHGTSYRYIVERMQKLLNKDKVNLIVCHLGNGASITAIKENNSYNTTMGLTPLEGLLMGTRCGDIDASVCVYLARQGLTIDQIETELNRKAGLLGIAGYSDGRDIEKLIAEGKKDGILARDIQVQRVTDYIVKYMNQLHNNVDAIIFTAGIGENDPTIIQEVTNNIFVSNLKIDQTQIKQKYNDFLLVSSKESDIPIYKIRTNEELMIASDTKKLIK